MDLSVIIPSLRPNILLDTINRIYETTFNIDYELLVVSPLEMGDIKKLPKVRIIKEPKKAGSNYAIELGTSQASGKYIMELSDDHLPDTNCFENIVKYMRLNDDKPLFLCGPRYHDLWEIHPENTVYGFYYCKNPCIKKSDLKIIGKFYDTAFNSYFGDPDLALRILANGGTVTICPTSWIEQRNIKNDSVVEERKNYFEKDSYVFLERWKPIYGYRVSDPNRTDIVNLGGVKMFVDNELPTEYCSRIFHNLKTEQWEKISLTNGYACSPYLLPDLLGYIMVYAKYIPYSIYLKLVNIIEYKLSLKHHTFNEIDFIYMLTELRDNKKIERLFHNIRKYRSIEKNNVVNVANKVKQTIQKINNERKI